MNQSYQPDIFILGAGIVGLTTATCLRLHGINAGLISEVVPYTSARMEQTPFVPSSVCGAILYLDRLPHPNAKETVQISEEAFRLIAEKGNSSGVFPVRHYVLSARTDPPYQDYPDLVRGLRGITSDPLIRNSTRSDRISGYSFETLIAEMPIYFPWLLQVFKHTGGQIIHQRLTSETVKKLQDRIVINCLGIGSELVFPSLKLRGSPVKGSLLKTPPLPLLRSATGERVSYQYYPGNDIHSTDDGISQSCYCYPRQDGFILGGSRVLCRFKDGLIVEENMFDRTLLVDGVSIPRAIADENIRLLNDLWSIKVDLDTCELLTGYRYTISQEQGGALLGETREPTGDNTLHCIGLGASGVTYSWGVAVKVLRLLLRRGICKKPPSRDSTFAFLTEGLSALSENLN